MENKNKDPRDFVLEMEKQGKVVIHDVTGICVATLDEIIKQPTDGLLYDLNRDFLSTLALYNVNERWVNDYAIALVVKKLKEELDKYKEKYGELD